MTEKTMFDNILNSRRFYVVAIILLSLAVLFSITAEGSNTNPVNVEPSYNLVVDGEILGYVWEIDGERFEHFIDQCCVDSCPVPEDTRLETPVPGDTDTPTDVPTEEATATSTLEPTATTSPTERANCNRGVGNYEENCDPGNSSGQGQGDGRPAGEDREESEGPPGRNR